MLNTVKEKWPEIINLLKKEFDLSDVSYNTWILPLEVAAVENDTIFIVVPEENLGLQYIKKKYQLPIKVCVEEVLGSRFEIDFVLPDQLKSVVKTSVEIENSPLPDVFQNAGLNSKYTFSSFVVGSNSNLAHAAALAVAESPAEIYNPLFIYGGVGLGKTHLMQSIAHFILQRNPSMKVLYVTSEIFTNEIVDAIRNKTTDLFKEKYRNMDVLLIDDIQFISGKESTQEEIFHTFNYLYENNKQIILSSDKPPKQIENLEERLVSRFLSGLTVDIQSPNYETRVAILKKKIEIEGNPKISDDVINFIATNVNSNIRELEGALSKIIFFAKLTSSEITLEVAQRVLNDLFNDSQKEITPDTIIKIVAEHYSVSTSDILSQKRSQEIVYPRQIIMYLCRSLTDVGLQSLGKKLGGRDHSTVIHGYEKIQREILMNNEKVKNDIEILKKKLIPS